MNQAIAEYIEAVVQEVPYASQSLIQKKCYELILEKTHNSQDEEEIKQALVELGSPRFVANRLLGEQRCLISPLYYRSYINFLKWQLLCIVIGLGLGIGYYQFVNPNIASEELLTITAIVSFFSIVTFTFFITLIFIFLERTKYLKVQTKEVIKWKLNNLHIYKSNVERNERNWILIKAGLVSLIIIPILAINDLLVFTINDFTYHLLTYNFFFKVVLGVITFFIYFKLIMRYLSIKMSFYSMIIYCLMNLGIMIGIVMLINSRFIINPQALQALDTYLIEQGFHIIAANITLILTWIFFIFYLLDTALIIYKYFKIERAYVETSS